MKLYTTLETVLKTEPNFVTDEGELKKWVVISKAQNYDAELIGLLLDEPELKAHFFIPVKDVLVFNQDLFVEFMEQKNYLNDSYTAYKNKIGLTIDGKFLNQRNEVALVWPYKDCVLEGGQSREEDKREEIFFNEVLAQDEINQLLEPKVFTNAKTFSPLTPEGGTFEGFTRNEEGTITDNLIIKGNNLLALHSLKEEFTGKVKLIYIDPPYNTGGDSFKYNDNFNHSTWLTFMKNRLGVARELLSDDGFVFISIDDNEHPYLRLVCDEIFGRANFVSDIIIQSNKGGRDYLKIAKSHEFLICYQKTIDSEINEIEKTDLIHKYKDSKGGFSIRELRNRNPKFHKGNRPNLFYPFYVNENIKDENGFCAVSIVSAEGFEIEAVPLNSVGKESCWRWGKPKAESNINVNLDKTELVAKQKSDGGWNVYEKHRKTNGKVKSIWDDSLVRTEAGTKELRKLLVNPAFQFPKPVELIKRIILMASNEGDVILDFFGGSGTTAQAVLEINQETEDSRNFIICEQLDYVETITVERIKKVIENNKSGSFTYLELKKHNQTFVDKIQEAKDTKALLAIWEEMKAKSFMGYNIAIQKQEEHLEEFKQLTFEEQQKLLITLLDKNQLYVNLTSLHDNDFECSAEEVKVTEDFYQLKK
jgi:adenine-specific DNA-methyltransferase